MTAVGIDLGGTKIEAQIFAPDWAVVDRQRIATPAHDYDALVSALADLVAWADAQTNARPPVGIGAAGLVHPRTGLALTANLCANDRPLPADLSKAVGRQITYVNDCRAMALSEAIFGAGRGHETVMSLILGTGVGGGIAHGGRILDGPTMTGGEFGHTSAPAGLVAELGLPVVPCGCGRMGCIETLIAGPGMRRIARELLGRDLEPPSIAAQRDGATRPVWRAWVALTADLLRNLILTADPDIIVLGGGLSKIPDVANALRDATIAAQIGDFDVPPIVVAEGGETSGARGAAYAAWSAAHD